MVAAKAEMLRGCFRDDADADVKVALMQEYAGARLLGIATRFQRAMLLFGPGGDGKSQVIEVIKAAWQRDDPLSVVGVEVSSSVTPHHVIRRARAAVELQLDASLHFDRTLCAQVRW